MRSAIGTIPIILAVNKIDLMPRASERDLRYMQRRLRDRGLNCTDVYAVSAHTGAGVDELAEGVLRSLGGRDVFVIGAANVGKSSLVRALTQMIAENVKYNEQSTSAKKRKQRLLDMPVTSSHLPGTTLQAIRVPCFASRSACALGHTGDHQRQVARVLALSEPLDGAARTAAADRGQ